MKLRLEDGLLFISATITYRYQQITLNKVLIDTGSGGTIFAIDKLLSIGLQAEENDPIHRIQGIGGSEFVFSKRVDNLCIGDFELSNFEIEVGAMAYDLDLEGIIGLNYLRQVRAIIDLAQLEIHRSPINT